MPPRPVWTDAVCPAHPFEADHDARGCADERLDRKLWQLRMLLTTESTDGEIEWLLAMLYQRCVEGAKHPSGTTACGTVPHA